jgi:hypothetical protein
MTDRQERIADTAKKKLDMCKHADRLQSQLDYLMKGRPDNAKINAKLIMQYTALLKDALQRDIEQTKALISVYDNILNNLITSKDNEQNR